MMAPMPSATSDQATQRPLERALSGRRDSAISRSIDFVRNSEPATCVLQVVSTDPASIRLEGSPLAATGR